MILEPGGVEFEERSDEPRLVVVLGCAAALRSRDSYVVVFAEDVVGALETDGGPVKPVEELRARTSEGGVFAEDTVEALVTEEDEAVVAQYGRLKKVAGCVRGGGMCVFRSVHVGASVDAVVVL